jgi:hypothetical protein
MDYFLQQDFDPEIRSVLAAQKKGSHFGQFSCFGCERPFMCVSPEAKNVNEERWYEP